MIWLFMSLLNLTAAAPPKINIDDAFAELNGELVLNFRNAKTGGPFQTPPLHFRQTLNRPSENNLRFSRRWSR